jgi:hypothetical protein
MKGYVAVTGIAAALIVLAHVARALEEGMHLVKDPWWMISTLAAAGISFWAIRLLAGARRGRP